MFGIGMPEMLLIFAIALIVIGPKKLPDLAKTLGRAMNEFKKATTELKQTMELEYDLKNARKTFDDIDKELKKPIDINPMKDKSEKIDSPPAGNSPADPKPTAPDPVAKTQMTDVSSPAADWREEDVLATDIPAELMPDLCKPLVKKEDIPGAVTSGAPPPALAEGGCESKNPEMG